jgi:hypothetical protein
MDVIHALLFVSILAQIITIVIKLTWGSVVIREGKQGRPWSQYFWTWEFNLGMMLISAGLVHVLFEALAITVFIRQDVETSIWVLGFVILSTHAAFWAALAWWMWWKRRFLPIDTA